MEKGFKCPLYGKGLGDSGRVDALNETSSVTLPYTVTRLRRESRSLSDVQRCTGEDEVGNRDPVFTELFGDSVPSIFLCTWAGLG